MLALTFRKWYSNILLFAYHGKTRETTTAMVVNATSGLKNESVE